MVAEVINHRPCPRFSAFSGVGRSIVFVPQFRRIFVSSLMGDLVELARDVDHIFIVYTDELVLSLVDVF